MSTTVPSAGVRLGGRDLVLLACLTLGWGLNWPIMKYAVRDFGPLTFRAISMIGGLMVLAAMVRSQGMSFRVRREDWVELFWLGLCNMTAWYILAMYGVKLLSSGKAAILGYTLPIWTAIWGILIFGERPSGRLWLGVGAAAFGVVLLIQSEFAHMAGRPLGTLCMLAAAAIWALGTFLMRRRRLKTPLPVLTFWCLAQAAVICSLIAVVFEHDQWQRWPHSGEWAAILYNAVVIIGLVQMIWFRLATLLPPVASALSVMMIPVIGLFSGMAFLGESPAWQDFFAMACILAAIATVLWPTRSVTS